MIFPPSGVDIKANVVPWTPTFAAGLGVPTTVRTDYSIVYRFGQMVFLYIDFTIENIGTASSSLLLYTPTTCRAAGMICGVKNPAAASPITILGYLIQDSTTISVVDYQNITIWQNGTSYTMQGWYTEFLL